MDLETMTLSSTDYEDIILRDSHSANSSDGDAFNYSSLEAMGAGDVGEVVSGPLGVQMHEAFALLLSALVVAVHGVLGMASLGPRAAWLLLNAGFCLGSLCCMYALASLIVTLRAALYRRCLVRDDDEDDDEEGQEEGEEAEEEEEEDAEEEEGEGEKGDGGHGADDEPDAEIEMENVVSAQLEKEDRVQRWLDDVQMQTEGGLRGPTRPISQRPLPLALPPAELAALSPKGRRALSLAYELSMAVRQQVDRSVRASLSAPSGQAGQAGQAQALDSWKLVRRSALNEPVPRAQKDSQLELMQPIVPTALRRSLGSLGKELHPRDMSTLNGRPQDTSAPVPSTNVEEDTPPPEIIAVPTSAPATASAPAPAPNSTTAATSGTASSQAEDMDLTPAAANTNTSASLFNFMRRFSGSRFLLNATATAAAAKAGVPVGAGGATGLPTGGLEMLQPEQQAKQTTHGRPSSVALPVVDAVALPLQENVMKVFSKGILSEGAVDPSTTSIQQDASRPILVAKRSTTLTVTDSTPRGSASASEVLGHLGLAAQALAQARSVLSASRGSASSVASSGPRSGSPDLTITTSRDTTAFKAEEDTSRPSATRLPDLDNEHKSLFDIKKSLLSSIPEVAAPDEDASHSH